MEFISFFINIFFTSFRRLFRYESLVAPTFRCKVFLSPEVRTFPEKQALKASDSETNEGRYFRTFMVTVLKK